MMAKIITLAMTLRFPDFDLLAAGAVPPATVYPSVGSHGGSSPVTTDTVHAEAMRDVEPGTLCYHGCPVVVVWLFRLPCAD